VPVTGETTNPDSTYVVVELRGVAAPGHAPPTSPELGFVDVGQPKSIVVAKAIGLTARVTAATTNDANEYFFIFFSNRTVNGFAYPNRASSTNTTESTEFQPLRTH